MKFKKGYHCRIDSWENDGDFRNNETIVLQDLESVKQLKHILENFFDGASDNSSDELYELAKPFILSEELKSKIDCADALSDFIGDILGYAEYGGHRTYDGMSVFHVPNDLSFETIPV